MSTITQKLEKLNQLVNNKVTGPKLYEFLEKNVPKDYDSNYGIPNGGWNFYINLNEYLDEEITNNVLGISDMNEKNFFMKCIFDNDYVGFLEEFNNGSTESDWERYTQNILNVISK